MTAINSQLRPCCQAEIIDRLQAVSTDSNGLGHKGISGLRRKAFGMFGPLGVPRVWAFLYEFLPRVAGTLQLGSQRLQSNRRWYGAGAPASRYTSFARSNSSFMNMPETAVRPGAVSRESLSTSWSAKAHRSDIQSHGANLTFQKATAQSRNHTLNGLLRVLNLKACNLMSALC